jgi:hypothetical protein
MAGRYKVTFDRIGRTHTIEPQIIGAADADDMAFKLLKFGRRFLASRCVDVEVDMEQGTGMFLAGFHNGGTFKFELVDGGGPS